MAADARPAARAGVAVSELCRLAGDRPLDPAAFLAPAGDAPDPPDADRRALALRVGAELAEGLATLHAKRRAHGAIGPDTVLLDDRGRPRLAGLKLTRAADEAGASPVRVAADVAGTQAVVRELLPSPGPAARAVLVHHYVHAAELAADLRRLLAGEPTLARPPTVAVAAGRWARARRRGLAAAAALGAVLLAGEALLEVGLVLAKERGRRSVELAASLLGPIGAPRPGGALAPATRGALRRAPDDDGDTWRLRAEAAWRRGDADALRAAGLALQRLGEDPHRLTTALAARLEGAAGPAHAPAPATVWDGLVLARLARLDGRPADALATVDELLRVRPDEVALHAERAWAQAESGDLAGAIETLDRALEVAGHATPARLASARFALALRRFAAAAEALDGLDGLEADLLRLELLQRTGPADEAAALLARLPADDPRVARAAIRAGSGAPAALAARFPDDARLQAEAARALHRAGRDDEALAAAARAEAFPLWSALLAWTDRPGEGAEVLARWRAAAPHDPRPALLAERLALDPLADARAALEQPDLEPGRALMLAEWLAVADDRAGWRAAVSAAGAWDRIEAGLFEHSAFWPQLSVHTLEHAPGGDPADATPRDALLASRLRREQGDLEHALAIVQKRLLAGSLLPAAATALGRDVRRLEALAADAPAGAFTAGTVPWSAGAATLLAPSRAPSGTGAPSRSGPVLCPLGAADEDVRFVFAGPDPRRAGVVLLVDLGWELPVERVRLALTERDADGRARPFGGRVEVALAGDPREFAPALAHERESDADGVVELALPERPVGRYARVTVHPAGVLDTLELARVEFY